MVEPIRVLVVGPKYSSPNSRGGMASVVSLMRDQGDPRVTVRSVATFVDDSRAVRLGVGVSGMLHAVLLLLLRRTDVLHIHLAHKGSVVRKALPLLTARAVRIPAVVHAHSYDFVGWFDGLTPRWQAIVRRALPADSWLVLGDCLAAEYADRLRLSPERVTVLRNPVRIPDEVPHPSPDGLVRAVFLGRLGQRKGSYDLVAAVAMLPADARSKLRVIAAGDGELDQVQAAIDAAGVGDVLSTRTWLAPADRDALLAASQIFVLPSYQEGLPMALLEAMGWGLVPVTTPVGGIAEVITDGVDGLLVSPGRPAELAEALELLVHDSDVRDRLSKNARQRAESFDLDRWFDTLVAQWRRLVQP